MEHEKRRLAQPVDLAEHMERKAQWDAINRHLDYMRSHSLAFTSTLDTKRKKETEHDRDVREYVTGIIDHDEYERREEIRLTREAENPLSGKAA